MGEGILSGEVERHRGSPLAVACLKAERDENTCREDFAPTEAVALAERLQELEAPAAAERQRKAGEIHGRGIAGADSAQPIAEGRTRDKVASAVGMGRTKLGQAKKVVEAAETGDLTAAEAVEEMDQTGNVEAAYRKVTGERVRDLRVDGVSVEELIDPVEEGSC